MAKRADVELRIRSKGLGTRDLADVNSELDKLVKNQERQADASALASRSLRDLNTEQRELSKIAGELSRRRGMVESLIGKQSDLSAAKARLNEIRVELAQLLSEKSRGTFLGDIDKAIKNVKTELAGAEKVFERSAKSVEKLDTALKEVGVDTSDAARALTQITTSMNRAQSATEAQTADIARYGAAVEQVKADTLQLAQAQARLAQEDQMFAARERDLRSVAAQEQAMFDRRESELRKIAAQEDRMYAERLQQTRAVDAAAAAYVEQEQAIERAAAAQRRLNSDALANAQIARRRADATAGFAGFDDWERQRNAVRLTGVEVQRVQGIHDRFNAVLARNANYQRALKAQTEGTTGAVTRQGTAVRGATGSMDRYGTSAGRAGRNVGLLADTGRKSLSVYQRMRGEVLSLAAAYVGLYQAVNVFASAMKVTQDRQAINAQLLTANGNNARLAARDQKFLREEAERLGLVYDDLAKKYANFAISAKAAGLSDSGTKEAFTQAADIVVGMRLAAEDADGVFRAFIQIMSKSRVQAEELRGQLGDRLPGAVAAFAKANNLALSDLDEYLKKGKGNIESFLAFLKEYASTVQASVKAGSTTVYADINRLKTAYNDFLELVATSGTSEELQKAVKSLTDALKGTEGKEFAQSLAAAFTLVVKTLQLVIEYFDEFLFIAKAFLALQLAKGVIGLSAAFLETAASMVRGATELRRYYTAAVAARTASTGLTGGMRALLMLTGPVGIALAALIGVFWNLHSASKALDSQLETLNKTMDGLANARNTLDLGIATDETNRQLDASIERVKELEERRKNWNRLNGAGLSAVVDSAKEGTFTRAEIERQISLELAKQNALRQGLEIAQRKSLRLSEQERAEDEAIRKEEEAAAKAAAAAAAKAGEEDAKKGSKGPSEKTLRGEENARLNAARAISKEILDLDQAIFDARIDGEARTSEQVQKNYELTIKKIESQIAEQELGLDRLAQNAAHANGGALTAADAAGIEAARTKLGLLNEALNTRAMENSLLADIAIAERAVNDVIGERDAKLDAINTKVELGLMTEVQGRREALALQQQYSGTITETINNMIALLQALPPDLFARLGAAKLITDLETARLKAQQVKTEFELIAENLGGQFASGAAEAFGVLGKGIAGFLQGTNSLGDAWKSASDAFRNFLADFLIGIAQAILQAIILKAIMDALGYGSGGTYMDAAMGALGASNHTGGIVGQDGKARWMPAKALARAERFHDGGMPGLKANEVPTILERGEEVLTADDPRHALNGGAGGGGSPVNIEVVNAIDSPSVVAAGLSDKATRQTFYNFMRADKNQIRQLLGIRN